MFFTNPAKHSLSRLLLLTMLVFIGSPYASPVMAQAPTSDDSLCSPVDLIVIVDQSSSMQYTDPENLRVDATRSIVDRLFLDAAVRCPGVTHQVGVIGFGNDAFDITPLQSINIPDIRDNWLDDAQRLKNNIQANLDGRTRVALAFERAADILDEEGRVDSRKSIILVTDGMPCAGGGDCDSGSWVSHYFFASSPQYSNSNYQSQGFDTEEGLVNRLEELFPLARDDISINVLLFSVLQRFDSVDSAWNQITSQRDGVYIPPEEIASTEQITRQLNRLMDDILGVSVNAISCNEPFYLEPYVSSTTIVSSIRPYAGGRITLIDPNGNRLAPQSTRFGETEIDYLELESIERYLIKNPVPGAWEIDASEELCVQINASFETIEIDSAILDIPDEVMVNTQEPYYAPHNQGFVEILVQDGFGDVFQPDPQFPLNVCATVSGPPAATSLLAGRDCIPFAEQREGVWRSEEPLPAPRQGDYNLEIVATVDSINPNTDELIEVFRIGDNYGTVEPVQIALNLVTPQGGSTLPLNVLEGIEQRNLPFEVAVEIRGVEENNLQPVSSVFVLPELANNAVEAVLQDAEGNEIERIRLTPDDESRFLLNGTFRDSVETIDMPGTYTILLELTSTAINNYNSEIYTFNQTGIPPVTIQRLELTGLQIIPVNMESRQLLNVVEDAQIRSLPVQIQARLVDQSGNRVPVPDVFTEADIDSQIVQAILINPDGVELERSWMQISSEDNTLWEATLRDNISGLDTPGEYTIRFEIGGEDTTADSMRFDESRYAFLSPATLSTSIERVRQYGVRPAVLYPGEGATLDLNRVNLSSGDQVPHPLNIRASLVDLTGNRLTRLEAVLDMSPDDIMQAILYTEDGNPLEQVQLQASDTGVFTGTMRNNIDELDPSGVYELQVVIDPISISDLPNSEYRLVETDSERVSFQRLEVIGMDARLVHALGQPISDDQPLVVPLYASVLQAALDRTQSPAFEFFVVDTDGNPLRLENYRRNDDITFDQILDVELVNEETDSIFEPQSVRVADDSETIFVTFDESLQSGTYQLQYTLNRSNLQPNVVELSTSIQTLDFTADSTGLLHNQTLWSVVRVLAVMLLIVLLINFWRINTGKYRMSGVIAVDYLEGMGNTEIQRISLGGLKLFRRQVTDSFRVNKSDGTMKVFVRVRSGDPRRSSADVTSLMGSIDAEREEQHLKSYFVYIRTEGDTAISVELTPNGQRTQSGFEVRHVK